MTRNGTHARWNIGPASLWLLCLLALSGSDATFVSAEEWPHWRGVRGDGTWQSDVSLSEWPEGRLPVLWRHPIGGGYSGIAIAEGRVYTMDYRPEPTEMERILCLGMATGDPLWTYSYEVRYGKLPYASGPRATPTIHAGRVYTLGAVGHIYCLDAESGELYWERDTEKQLDAQRPTWGFAASPVIWRSLVITHIGARPGGSFVAFDRLSGEEVWRASSDSAGYCTPILIEHNGYEQLVGWTPEHVVGLSPSTGAIHWTIPYVVTNGVSIATPIFEEGIVFVSGYWEGAKAIRLGPQPQDAQLLWEDTENLRGLMAQPLYRQGHVYLLDRSHGLTCFQLRTGEKRWDDGHRMTPRGRNPQATMVWVGDTDNVLALNSEGELILARFTPEGYIERFRSKIIGRTWAHPGYADGRVVARSDAEIVCAPLPRSDP